MPGAMCTALLLQPSYQARCTSWPASDRLHSAALSSRLSRQYTQAAHTGRPNKQYTGSTISLSDQASPLGHGSARATHNPPLTGWPVALLTLLSPCTGLLLHIALTYCIPFHSHCCTELCCYCCLPPFLLLLLVQSPLLECVLYRAAQPHHTEHSALHVSRAKC